MELKQFTKNVAAIKTMGAKADKMIHESAMFALEHLNVHGNNSPANQLTSALSASMRKEALVTWFLAFGMCKRDSKDNTLVYAGKKELKLDEHGCPSPSGSVISGLDILPFADDIPFYNFTKETKASDVYDIEKAILRIVKQAAKFNKEGKKVEHVELLSRLSEIVPGKVAA